MITETGKVVAVRGDQVWVQTIRTSACQQCAARHGCGQKALASVTGGRANRVLVANSVGARVGDEVLIGIPEEALLGASFLAYALPLLGLVAGSLAGHSMGAGGDLPALTGGITGLVAGLAVAALRQRQKRSGYEPRLLRIHQTEIPVCR